MAELTTTRKMSPKVDLTAMVDLAFLLITFFMLTTSLSKPVAMDIAKPDPGPFQLPVRALQTMTILLGKGNTAAWYMGEADKAQPVVTPLAQIRAALVANKNKVESMYADSKRTIFVIIKPTSGAKYKNLVDIMDELHITDIKNAPAIDDVHITSEETAFMTKNKLL